MASYTTQKTVVGLFDDMSRAQRAVTELEGAGIPRSDISVLAGNDLGRYGEYVDHVEHDEKKTGKKVAGGAGAGAAVGGGLGLVAGLTALAIPGFGPIIAAGPLAAALTGAGIGAAAGGLIGGLTSAGVSREDAEYYAEAVRRGDVLVTVKTTENLAERAADILDRAGAHDVDERAKEWRSSGWKGPSSSSTSSTSDAIPVVEEDVHVGKRERVKGGVRVYSEMHERPVEETVDLREEHVDVKRRPVDRPANLDDFDRFREGTIELRETVEEPVVEKSARVKEEVLIDKQVGHHQETVRSTARSTDVHVERIGEEYDRDFRSDFSSRYGGRNYTYEQYAPAYEFGYRYANDDRYRNRDWARLESDMQRDWETRGHGPWENFKDSIRYGWERARRRT